MDFYFNKSLIGWAIKDRCSRYIYANKLACDYFRLPTGKIKGLTDADLIPDLGGYHKNIMRNDVSIINSLSMSVALKIFNYGGNYGPKAYLVEKRPMQLSDESICVACSYLELTNVYFSSFFNSLNRKPLVFTRPSEKFTNRDWEVIILLLCGMRRSNISNTLGISCISVRNRISLCCEKAGVRNLNDLLEYLSHNGWDNYIPPFFLKQKHMILI